MIYNYTIATNVATCEVHSNNLKHDVWAGTSSCYLEIKINYKNEHVGLLVLDLLPFLNLLAFHQHMGSLNLCYGYYFGRCSSELAELVPFPYFQGRSNCYSVWLHDFSVTIPTCYKDINVNSFFPHTVTIRIDFSAYWMLSFDLWSKWL